MGLLFGQLSENDECVCCGCDSSYDCKSESVGQDQCPTSGYPCSGSPPDGEGAQPSTCANAQLNATLTSTKSWPIACLTAADGSQREPKADVSASFDDRGSVTGQTTAFCDRTGEGRCVSCGFQATIKPIIVNNGNTFQMRVNIQARNAYWGGPYSYYVCVRWYIE